VNDYERVRPDSDVASERLIRELVAAIDEADDRPFSMSALTKQIFDLGN
jgi:hypothetical protein